MATRGRRATQLAAALAVAAAAAAGPAASPAQAAAEQHVSPTLLQSNWYWHKLVNELPLAVADPGEPSLVPDGDLPVASHDGMGTPAKDLIVAFNLGGAGEGSTIDKFSVTLTVDGTATNVMLEAPQLVAGVGQRNWFNGPGGEADTVNAPPVDSTRLVPGVWASDGKSVTFVVNGLAQSWIDDANFGLEVLPQANYATPFQVSFLGGSAVKATMTYTPGSPVAEPVVNEPPVTAPENSGTSTAPEIPAGPVDGGSGLSGTPPETGSPTVPPPAVDQPAPTTVVPAAQALPEVSSRPSTALFWSAGALLLLLVVMSLILGGEPQAASAARASRLTTVLRARSRSSYTRSVPA